MNMFKELAGKCLIDGVSSPCTGEIKIINQTGKNVYVSWRMFDLSGNPLAVVTKNYFIDQDRFVDEDIVRVILGNILKYRTGRNKIFSEVKVINSDSG
jgi:hypothetical protein